jgi:hypothetical protein
MAFFDKNTASFFAKIWVTTLKFEKNANFFSQNLAKFAENYNTDRRATRLGENYNIVYFGQFFNYRDCPKFLATFFLSMYNF